MNRENVLNAIELMKRAERLEMGHFQRLGVTLEGENKIAKSVEALHTCGNTACFAGYLAVDAHFKSYGGSCSAYGLPILDRGERFVAEEAVAVYLGVSLDLASSMVYGDDDFYPVAFDQVEPKHVIEKLQLILDGKLE